MSAFNGLIGQDDVKARLRGFLNERNGHAFIFAGPEGIGRRSFARSFAASLLCLAPEDERPCGKCRSCSCLREGTHPDYTEMMPEKNGSVIKTDTIRKTLVGDINMLPQISAIRVYFIAADHLNEQSQNVILKTLEEPPGHAVIIMSAEKPGIMLPTVISRSVIIKFGRYSPEELLSIIASKGHEVNDTIKFYAAVSEGVPGKVIRMLEDEGLEELRSETAKTIKRIPKSGYKVILIDIYQFFNDNKDSIDDIIMFMISWFRDAAVLCNDPLSENVINIDQREEINSFRSVSGASSEGCMRCVEICGRSAAELKMNAAFEINICSMLLKLRKEFK